MLVGEQIAEAVFICPPKSRQAVVARSNDDSTTSGHLRVTIRVLAILRRTTDRRATGHDTTIRVKKNVKLFKTREEQGSERKKRFV